jgi:hypothetical protein
MRNDHLMTSLLTLSRHRFLDAAADIVVIAAAILAFLFLLAGYLLLPALPVYGHDEMHYYPSFYFKLLEDGRWLNYLLHDFLRSVPLPLWSMVYLSLAWVLFYRIARLYAFSAAYAALVASTIVLAYPFVEISLWPGTVVPVLLLGLLAIWLHAREIPYQVIYLVSGILMFGSMQTLYFVLPLLFVPEFLQSSQPSRARWRLLFSHMCWWVGGSVAGVLCMSLILRLLAGTFFLQPAEWRDIHPAVDWNSLLESIRYVSGNFLMQVEILLRLGGVTWGFILVVAAIALLRSRALLGQVQALLLMLAVLLSFFAFSIPLSAVILTRSLSAMAAAMVLFLAILPGPTALGRMLGAVLLLKLGYNFSAQSQDYFEVHTFETGTLLTKLEQLFPGYPKAYGTVALYGTMDTDQAEASRFNDPYRMHPLLLTLGVTTYLDCRIIPSRCDNVGVPGEPIAVIPFANGQLDFSVDAANVGIIRFRD